MSTTTVTTTRPTLVLRPWSPLGELHRLDRLVAGAAAADRARAAAQTGAEPWRPASDVVETAEAYVAELDLPGVPREAVQVEVQGRMVEVRGERPAPAAEGPARTGARPTGAFAWRLRLPLAVDTDAVSATHVDGVLTLRVPKRPEATARRVEVQAG